jgi:hypothetical protein
MAMKITQTGPTNAASRQRQVGRKPAGAGEASFRAAIDGAGASAAEIAASAPLAALGAVLSVQEVPDALAERRQALSRGRDLLAELEQLQLGLLDGRPAETTLGRLSGLLAAPPPAVDDPKLATVLDAIELRAAVELAKLEHQRDI